MKLFRNHKKLAVSSLALVVAIMAGGAAYAFFTSSGTGTGNVYVGSAPNLTITQLTSDSQTVYNSLISPEAPDTWGLSYGGTNTTELGNAVTLADNSTDLSSVVVALDSQACQTGDDNEGPASLCTTTPGATFPGQITLSIYNTSGSLLTSDTETFQIPYRPTSAIIDDPSQCAAGSGDNWSGYPNDGSQWYDASNSHCYYGITYDATFKSFPAVALPSTVVYGISYNASSGPMSSLNVEESSETKNVSVGSDANPGNLWLSVSAPGAGNNDAGPGEVTCSDATTSFASYSTAAGTDCGLQTPNADATVTDIPQVEINTSTTGNIYLFPGGPGENVDFSITNSSSTPAYVQGVTFAFSSLASGCQAAWFNLTQPTTPDDVTIPANSTVDYQPSGGSISLTNEPYSQNQCEGDVPGLTFTSN
jgi:hypothetical protein